MLQNKKTNGFLVIDIGNKIVCNEEEYSVTATPNNIGPITRSVFVIERVSEKDGFTDDLIHYGQQIRFRSNDLLFDKLLYLRSLPINPMRCSKFTRLQEVTMHSQPIFNISLD